MVSGCLAVALIGAAVVVGRRTRRSSGTTERGREAPAIGTVLTAALGGALVAGVAPETWLGVFVGTGAIAAVGVWVLAASRRPGWSVRHSAAVGVGFLLARGLMAFAYYPLLGEVAPGPKYAHNVIMLAVVMLAGWLALRPRSGAGGQGAARPA